MVTPSPDQRIAGMIKGQKTMVVPSGHYADNAEDKGLHINNGYSSDTGVIKGQVNFPIADGSLVWKGAGDQ
ncbi:hypothetical protein SAMN04488122_2494 [Chitinophaga arvensicola]|uniref:Uncharacterized protein n=1 Tax=Chitinophaga arvensicola TaxID=29529 RepID=A0A1I0R9M8_9BACT|nr:hypothetical protein SAMN04488122_2494 [Chitinophaga arvensicola]